MLLRIVLCLFFSLCLVTPPYALTLLVGDYAVCNGVVDDTQQIQTVLTAAGLQNTTVIFPDRACRISSTVVYTRTAGAVHIYGNAPPGREPSGSQLLWYGGNTAIIRLVGAVNFEVDHLSIDGRGFALYGLEFWSNQPAGGSSSYSGHIHHIHGGGVVGLGSSVIRLGNGTTYQVSEVAIDHVTLIGYSVPGTSQYGISGGVGNAKNFSVKASQIAGFQYGIATAQGGTYTLEDVSIGSNTVTDIQSQSALLLLNSVQSEGSRAFLKGTGTISPVIMQNIEWNGITDATDYVIDYYGAIDMRNALFSNARTPTSEAKIRTGATNNGSAVMIGLSITNSIFAQSPAGAYPPVYDGSGVYIGTLTANAGLSFPSLHLWNNFRANAGYAGGVSRLLDFKAN